MPVWCFLVNEMEQVDETRCEHWIPHRGAMCLIDRVLLVDAERVVAEAEVPFDGLFVDGGCVPAWVAIEYMAQAVAAWAGRRARAAGGTPRVGYLLGSRRFDARRTSFPCGTKLRIEARCELVAANGLGQFDCRVEMEGQEVAVARISVYDPPEGALPPGGTQ